MLCKVAVLVLAWDVMVKEHCQIVLLDFSIIWRKTQDEKPQTIGFSSCSAYCKCGSVISPKAVEQQNNTSLSARSRKTTDLIDLKNSRHETL
eukprot:2424914-Amphidinium_carterae.2